MSYALIFDGSAPSLKKEDITAIESQLNIEFPLQFEEHYLRHNGGVPSRAYVHEQENDEYLEISVFFSIRYQRPGSTDETIEQRYANLTNRGIIPADYLPFASDWGGNLFCVQLSVQRVVLLLLDLGPFTEDSIRPLALSFTSFLDSLVTEEEAEE